MFRSLLPQEIIFEIIKFLGINIRLFFIHKELNQKFLENTSIYTIPGVFDIIRKFAFSKPGFFTKWYESSSHLTEARKIKAISGDISGYGYACEYFLYAVYLNYKNEAGQEKYLPVEAAIKKILRTNGQNEDLTSVLSLVADNNKFNFYLEFYISDYAKQKLIALRTNNRMQQPEYIYTLLLHILCTPDINTLKSDYSNFNLTLRYVKGNIKALFDDSDIQKYGKNFICALFDSCLVTLEVAKGTHLINGTPFDVKGEINSIEHLYQGMPINLQGANLRNVNLCRTNFYWSLISNKTQLNDIKICCLTLLSCIKNIYDKDNIKIDSSQITQRMVDKLAYLIQYAEPEELHKLKKCVEKDILENFSYPYENDQKITKSKHTFFGCPPFSQKKLNQQAHRKKQMLSLIEDTISQKSSLKTCLVM